MFTSACAEFEALVCHDENLVEEATFCNKLFVIAHVCVWMPVGAYLCQRVQLTIDLYSHTFLAENIVCLMYNIYMAQKGATIALVCLLLHSTKQLRIILYTTSLVNSIVIGHTDPELVGYMWYLSILIMSVELEHSMVMFIAWITHASGYCAVPLQYV